MRFVVLALILALSLCGCSVRKIAINKIGDALASGGSTYASDDDLELVQGALPFGLKLVETMLEEAPKHKGLLFAAAQGFTSYSYIAVQQDFDRVREFDFYEGERLRARARRLYLRGHSYGMRGLEVAHPGFAAQLRQDPHRAVAVLRKRDLDLLYWSAASLGLAISSSRDDVSMIARIPEVEALVDRGLEIDETWQRGALHEFAIVLAAAKPGRVDYAKVQHHYQRAVAISGGASAGLHVSYAEAVSVPRQERDEFQKMLERALAVVPDEKHKDVRLMNELAQRRARWLSGRIDDLILGSSAANPEEIQTER